jgi:signal transduction histidine kinase
MVLIIAYLHFSTAYGSPAHTIYAELHYIPVLISALIFGLRGALFAAAAIVVVYAPYLVYTWTGSWFVLLVHSVHVIFPAFLGVVVGFLIELQTKKNAELERNRYLAGLGQAGAALVHDLRNPVITIRGFSKRIEQGKGDTQMSAKIIGEAVQRIEAVIDSVLIFAKPLSVMIREEDISAFLREVVELENDKAEEHRVNLVKEFPESEITAKIDRILMQRALLNVVTNAVEASRAGQDVVVSASRSRISIKIGVTDKGEGMDEETLKNLFVPFFTRKARGTGLGMAITKKIVEEHRGGIEVTSKKGSGTRITITLPA